VRMNRPLCSIAVIAQRVWTATKVDNLFDKHSYSQKDGYPMTGRNYPVGIGTSFGRAVGRRNGRNDTDQEDSTQ